MAKKKTVSKVDKLEALTMSQKGLSDTTTTINVDTVKASKEELVEQIKATPMVPSEIFGDSDIATKEIMAETEIQSATMKGPELNPIMDTTIGFHQVEGDDVTSEGILTTSENTIEDNGLGFDESKPQPMTNEELTAEYELMRQVSYQMIEKQYVIEWKIFGEDYKGKYRILQVDDKTWLIGTTHTDLKYISAPSKKEAYLEYIADKS